MTEGFCAYEESRGELIVAYVYGELDAVERESFERHLAQCSTCRLEIEALGVVRQQLSHWAPPEPRALTTVADPPAAVADASRQRSAWDLLGDIPAWAQVAEKYAGNAAAQEKLVTKVRTGGNGVVGHAAIAGARPDGYTIGMLTLEIGMMHHQGLTALSGASYAPLALVNLDPAALQVRTDFGKPGYGGPCPPEGDHPHRYLFTVFAVSEPALQVTADTSAAAVGFQLNFKSLAKARIMGLYKR